MWIPKRSTLSALHSKSSYSVFSSTYRCTEHRGLFWNLVRKCPFNCSCQLIGGNCISTFLMNGFKPYWYSSSFWTLKMEDKILSWIRNLCIKYILQLIYLFWLKKMTSLQKHFSTSILKSPFSSTSFFTFFSYQKQLLSHTLLYYQLCL